MKKKKKFDIKIKAEKSDGKAITQLLMKLSPKVKKAEERELDKRRGK